MFLNRSRTLHEYIPAFVHGRESRTARVSTLEEMEQILWVRQWRTHPEGFHRFSLSTRTGDHLLMAETAYGLKSWVVGVFDRPLPGLPEWRRRDPRIEWPTVVPGDLPTRRLVLRSSATDFREHARIFEVGTGFRLVHHRPQGVSVYRDDAAAKALAAGKNYYGPYAGMMIAAHEVTFELLGDVSDYRAPIHHATRFFVYCAESTSRIFTWQAYSVYEDSGESSEILAGDGPELARRLEIDAS